MAEESYKEYLATRVLTENQPVSMFDMDFALADSSQITYRLLSRALNVNVNIAKQ